MLVNLVDRVRHPEFGEGIILESEWFGWPDAGHRGRTQWTVHTVKFDGKADPVEIDGDDLEHLDARSR